MMKKLSKVALLVCLLTFATSAFAQNQDYPRYGFWSNWSIGVSGSYHWQLDNLVMANNGALPGYHSNTNPNGMQYGWGAGRSAGMGVILEKPINNVWVGRLRFNWPTLFTKTYPQHEDVSLEHSELEKSMDNRATATFELKINMIDVFKGYDPNRCFNVYLFGGGGAGFSFNMSRMYEHVCIMLDAGAGVDFNLSEHSTIFAEIEADISGDAPGFTNPSCWKSGTQFHHMDFLTTIGYMFNFGVTPTDRALANQRTLLTQDRFDALTQENEALKQDVVEAQADEKKLENQINDLNKENANLRDQLAHRNDAAADSLRGVIDQLKADQLNYYAIPFSILYPNDVWNVPDTEYIKLQAIARVMKDNPDVKLTIVGFCDYTASDEYNWKLSEKRAKEVKRLLVKKYGVDENRLEVDWKGKTIAFGDIKYSLNRRVSFYRVIE